MPSRLKIYTSTPRSRIGSRRKSQMVPFNSRWKYFLGNKVTFMGAEYAVTGVGREGFQPCVHLNKN